MAKNESKNALRPRDKDSLLSLSREALVEIIFTLEAKLDQLSAYVRESITQKYGPKSERFTPGQLLLFPGEEKVDSKLGGDSEASAGDRSQGGTTKAAKPGHGRGKMPDDLDRKPITAKRPSDQELACPDCSAMRVEIRKVLRNSRYACAPAAFHVEDLYAVIYGCPNGHKTQLIAEVDEPVKNGIAAPTLMAQVCVSRHVDHMPFNRQTGMYARAGVSLSRSTLSDVHAHSAGLLLPLYELMKTILLQSRIVSTDDTPVKVLDRKKAKNIKTGRKWVYFGDTDHPVTVFDYTTGRGRDGPLSFLDGFKGKLQGDCFSGNLAVSAAIGTVLSACLAHARRYFVKAMLNDKDGCDAALRMFQSLYEIERVAIELELSFDEIRMMREQEAVPLLANFHEWLQHQYAKAQPKSSFGKALFYCLNNWNELTQYVTDGELKIDNNHSEREMKYVAMGIKAWLFFGSDEGGKNDAIVATIIATCRRHGVEPWTYLTDVLQKLAENPKRNLEELLPFNWKQNSGPMPKGGITDFKDTPKTISA